MNIKRRIVVYSNNGHVGKCSLFVFRCAQIWHLFTRYNGLREIGCYVC